MYRSSLQDQLDYQSTIDFARKTGEREGLSQGLKQGRLPFVQYLIENSDFDDQKIAGLTSVDVDVVTGMRGGGSGVGMAMVVS